MDDIQQERRAGDQANPGAGLDELVVRTEFRPVGRQVDVRCGTTVLAAARAAGVELVSVCGGYGLCGTCRVFGAGVGLGPPTELELVVLSPGELSAGTRLACQALVVGGSSIDVPAGSLSTPQRLQFEGTLLSAVAPDPAVVVLDVQVQPPTLDDLRSDATRLCDAVSAAGQAVKRANLAVLASAPTALRAQDWAVRAVVHRAAERGSVGEIVALLPQGTAALGAAIDIGTTKLAAYLVDLESGETVAKGAAPNPQVAMGEDVMSRIVYTLANGPGAEELHA